MPNSSRPKRDDLPTDFQSGFGESQFTQENTLFNDGNVWVSLDQFVNGTAHYPIRLIKSAEVKRGPSLTWGSVAVFIAGLAATTLWLYVGLAVAAGAVMFIASRKPYYQLVLAIGGKKVKAMSSADAKYLNRIFSAIVEAIEHRKQSSS